MKTCVLCGRKAPTTRHHIVPKCRKRNRMPDEAKKHVGVTLDFCRDCHRAVHSIFTEKQLSAEFYTLDRLRAEPRIQKFVAWIRKRPAETYFGSDEHARRRE